MTALGNCRWVVEERGTQPRQPLHAGKVRSLDHQALVVNRVVGLEQTEHRLLSLPQEGCQLGMESPTQER